ncbi:hypothetical protein SAMN04488587_0703 [Methanococcoides vulcani]|uniref:DUF2119 domain-containing protein n=1 Tax=Methanococcoides vulcani TaxID=1353158 RepID=A0A1H9YNN1_9EURY|nr:DUF2119 domain-containing protein [Methanococcoides vulcani]SES70622.1 hypothetical protein SAMN04488587_0703 [Methanococcoides vulcani]
MLLKLYGMGRPFRLFVSGLHGSEWRDTSSVLLNLGRPFSGTLAILPVVSRGKYISTLDRDYYSGIGKTIVDVVEEYKPDIYVELHSYSKGNFCKLVSKDRVNNVGVPGFSTLENGVLMGSVSPLIRREHFPVEALCLTFEVEKNNHQSQRFVSGMLDVVKDCNSRDEFIEYMMEHYPEVAKKAIEDYKKFYGL